MDPRWWLVPITLALTVLGVVLAPIIDSAAPTGHAATVLASTHAEPPAGEAGAPAEADHPTSAPPAAIRPDPDAAADTEGDEHVQAF